MQFMKKVCSSTRRGFVLLLLLASLSQGFGAVIDPAQLLFWTAPFGYFSGGRPGGIAFDGSNYLCTVQADTGQLSAQRLTSADTLLGEPITLDRVGTPPMIAFDGSNYLSVWAETNNSPSVLFGQFIDTQGTKLGSPFRVGFDDDVTQVGGLIFDGENYFVVWENKATGDRGAAIRGQSIGLAGRRLNDPVLFSEGTNNNRFPAVAFDGSRKLVTWLAQASETGSSDVTGRFLENDNTMLAPFIISQTTISNASPISVAAGKTNFLVAWNRQTGPFPQRHFGSTILTTNLWLPMIYGRLVAAPATFTGDEFQISLARGGQMLPAVAFDDHNFLVAWEDNRDRTDIFNPCALCPSWEFFAQLVDQTGQLVESAFPLFIFRDMLESPESLVLVYLDGQFRALRYVTTFGRYTSGATLTPDPLPSLQNNGLTSTGDFQMQLLGRPDRLHRMEYSTDLTHWNPIFDGHFYQRPGNVIIPANATLETNQIFFRAVNHVPECIGNLRRIQTAKQSWALERDRTRYEAPADSELFGPGRYLPAKPVCPTGGTYNALTLGAKTTCSEGPTLGHTL